MGLVPIMRLARAVLVPPIMLKAKAVLVLHLRKANVLLEVNVAFRMVLMTLLLLLGVVHLDQVVLRTLRRPPVMLSKGVSAIEVVTVSLAMDELVVKVKVFASSFKPMSATEGNGVASLMNLETCRNQKGRSVMHTKEESAREARTANFRMIVP